MKKTLLLGFLLSVLCLFPVQRVYALSIVADATGYDAGYVTDFWGVQFVAGEGDITSVTFNLSATGGAFDYDGSQFLLSQVPAVEPIIGATIGLSIGDIDYPRANGGHIGEISILTFTFLPGSFTSGDSFRFSGDVDGAGGSVTSAGGVFGSLGAIFSVTMSTGETYQVPFLTINSERSEASIDVAPVPEPATLLLLASGLVGLAGYTKRFRRANFYW